MNEILLSPMMHRDSDRHYRVPVHIVDGKHTIFVGDNLRRHFDVNTLPEMLKHKLSMINATRQGGVINTSEVYNMEVYTIPDDSEFSMIGWRVTEELYCVILTREELYSLRGEHGNTGE